MDNKIFEIFIPGPAGRLEAKYYKSKKNTFIICECCFANYFSLSKLDYFSQVCIKKLLIKGII